MSGQRKERRKLIRVQWEKPSCPLEETKMGNEILTIYKSGWLTTAAEQIYSFKSKE